MRTLTHLSLFSGIGGLDLAAEAAGFVTVGQCEWADYPTKILEKHWPDVPRWRDIRTLTKESFYERIGLRTVDVVSGGFPCQPFSVAGKQRGKEDDRYLWPEMLRVIKDLRPAWVIGENVPGIINLALDTVLFDLEAIGYTAQPFVIPACGVDAPHRRDRVCIVAYREEPRSGGLSVRSRGSQQKETDADGSSKALADAESIRLQGQWSSGEQISRTRPEAQEPERSGYVCDPHSERLEERNSQRMGRPEEYTEFKQASRKDVRGWTIDGRTQWAVEPDVGRVAHGVPNRVDRIKCLGNAVVPQQFYPFFQCIADIENNARPGG